MHLRFSDEDEAFRREVADWLEAELSGAFAAVRGRGGPGDEHALLAVELVAIVIVVAGAVSAALRRAVLSAWRLLRALLLVLLRGHLSDHPSL